MQAGQWFLHGAAVRLSDAFGLFTIEAYFPSVLPLKVLPRHGVRAAPPPLRQFVRHVARLGGFLGRTHDGDPGVQTLWRGLRRLDDIVWTYRTLGEHPDLLAPGSTCV